MVVNRGGLLASTGLLALSAGRFANFGRVPEGEGESGGGSAAVAEAGAAAEEEDFFGSAEAKPGEEKPGEAKPGEAKPGEEKPGEEKPGEAALAEWMKSFSGEKPGEGQLSNQEWLAKIGAKDLDDVVNRYRAAEKGLRDSGKVKIPGEGATEAEVKAYREAVGAPEEAAGYAVELPQGAEGYEIDGSFLDPMKAIALKHNLPAAAFKDLGDAFMAAQLESLRAEVANNNAARDATLKEWGPQAEEGKDEFRRGLDVLGLKTADVKRIQSGFGVKQTMELVRKIGQMAGEDFFAGNGGRPAERFGVSSAAEAQKAIDAMIADKDTAAKIRAKDPVTVARYNRLTDALGHFKERAAAAR